MQAVISDTVGFIQKLPPQLVAAFQATLDDIKSASLILHVVDCSHPLAAAQSDAVMKVQASHALGTFATVRRSLSSMPHFVAPLRSTRIGVCNLIDIASRS